MSRWRASISRRGGGPGTARKPDRFGSSLVLVGLDVELPVWCVLVDGLGEGDLRWAVARTACLLVLLGAASLGAGTGGLGAAVAVDEELGEEHGVREVHDEGKVGSKDELVAVGAVESSRRNDPDTDNHLRELERSEEDAPVGTNSTGSDGVVEVHEGVDEEVHDGEGPAGAVEVVGDLVRVPAVQGGHDMVVVVEEDQGLLAEDDEDGITELEELGDVEEEDPTSGSEAEARGVADDLKHRAVHEVAQELREGVVETKGREDAEAKVPRDERPAEIERLAVLHDILLVKSNITIKQKVSDLTTRKSEQWRSL